MELIVLSQNNCAPCKKLKLFLENEGVEYKEINLSENPEKIDEYYVMSTPVTVLENDGEELMRVAGFDEDEIELLLSNLD